MRFQPSRSISLIDGNPADLQVPIESVGSKKQTASTFFHFTSRYRFRKPPYFRLFPLVAVLDFVSRSKKLNRRWVVVT
jgi:hypothetical protein